MPFWKRKTLPRAERVYVRPSADRIAEIDSEIDLIQARMRVEHDNTDLWVRSSALHLERDLLDWRGSGVVAGYRTLAAHDACPACKRLSRQVFAIDEPCPLPCPDCSNTNYGFCRCTMVAILDIDWPEGGNR